MKSRAAVTFLTACLFLTLSLPVAGCKAEREKVEIPQQTVTGMAATPTLLATIAKDEKPPAVPGHGEDSPEQKVPPAFQIVFSDWGKGAAYSVDRGGNVCVLHNGKPDKEYAAIGTIVLSSDGRRIAYPAQEGGKWHMVVDGREGKGYDTMLAPLFSPDGKHVAYQATEGNKFFLVMDDTYHISTPATYSTPVFSADSTRIVFVEAASSNADMRLVVSDLAFREQSVKKSIDDQMFITSGDRKKIVATQLVGGKRRVIEFSFDRPDSVHEGALYDLIERVAVSDNGEAVTYCALKDGKRLIVLNEREEPLPKGLLPELPVIRPDKKGVGLLLASDHAMSLHQAFYHGAGPGKRYDEASSLAYSGDGRHYAYAAREGERWLVVADGRELPRYDRVVDPRFSPDGRHLVYRARRDGKRFVVVADPSGKTVSEHPGYDQVFDVHFTADGRSIAYGIKDGQKLIWNVEPLQ